MVYHIYPLVTNLFGIIVIVWIMLVYVVYVGKNFLLLPKQIKKK